MFYRTSSPSGQLPCFLSLEFSILQSRATGIADHILPLGDWFLLYFVPPFLRPSIPSSAQPFAIFFWRDFSMKIIQGRGESVRTLFAFMGFSWLLSSSRRFSSPSFPLRLSPESSFFWRRVRLKERSEGEKNTIIPLLLCFMSIIGRRGKRLKAKIFQWPDV